MVTIDDQAGDDGSVGTAEAEVTINDVDQATDFGATAIAAVATPDPAVFGSKLTAEFTNVITDADGDEAEIAYQWYRDGAAVAGETALALNTAVKKGETWQIKATATVKPYGDEIAAQQEFASNEIVIGNTAPTTADAALFIRKTDAAEVKISFVLAAGSVPAGAVLKVYPVGAESEAIALTDGTVLDAKADTTYLIDYRKTASTPMALATPPVKQVQMRRGTMSLAIDFDIPDGCTLKGDANVLAFAHSVEDETVVYNVLDGQYGTFNANTATLNMTNMTNVDQIRFNYWYTDGTRTCHHSKWHQTDWA